MKLSLTYNDVSISPKILSTIESRDLVSTEDDFLGIKYSLPVMAAPMRTVTGDRMARKLKSLGCLSVMARSSDNEADLLEYLAAGTASTIPSVAATGDYLERAKRYWNSGATIICIDTANGFHLVVKTAIRELKKLGFQVIAGNVGSVEGFKFLRDAGADAVRVGIGNGSVCSTSIATGVGVGQVTLLMEIMEYCDTLNKNVPLVIADGGIKEPGDVCKALLLGVDVVMVGNLFAGTEEAPGSLRKDSNGNLCKLFAGEASRSSKGENSKYVEGVSTLIPYKGSVEEIVKELSDGLKSSMAYMNCRNLGEFRCLRQDYLVQLSQSARMERSPHALSR